MHKSSVFCAGLCVPEVYCGYEHLLLPYGLVGGGKCRAPGTVADVCSSVQA